MSKDNEIKNKADHLESRQNDVHESSTLPSDSIERRKAIRTIVAGGTAIAAAATADKWGRPVVNSLVLPAHAQTSTPTPSAVGNFTSGGGIVFNSPAAPQSFGADEAISEELLEFFFPAAQAASGDIDCGINCSVTLNATFNETTADFCAGGDINSFDSVGVNTPGSGAAPTLTGGASFSGGAGFLDITAGTFNQSTGNWQVDIISSSNVATVVELLPGGPGAVCGD